MKRDIEFLFEIGTLRYLDRVWKQFSGPDCANISEHLFRVAWVALTIAREEQEGNAQKKGAKINHEKLLKMALVHDVSESRTGDVHYLSRQYTKRDEKLAMADIFVGTVHEKEMTALAAEYEARTSIESQIVKDADTIDIQFEIMEFRSKGHSLGRVFSKRRDQFVYPTLKTATAKKMWKEIEKAEPHDWHLTSPRNRYKAGDWKKK